MNKAAALVAEIQDYCRAHADPVKAKKWARYFKEGYDPWGIIDRDHEFYTTRQADWLERYRGLGIKGFLQAGEMLFASGKYEEGAMAIRFLAAHRDDLDAKSVAGLTAWFAAGVANWAHTDVLCGEVLSPLLVAGAIGMNDLAPWRDSPHRFQRRASVVAMLGLVKKGAGTKKLVDYARPLMLDPERVVQQGVGWFLREVWKKDPAPVEALLLKFKDTAPRLIYQYATEKMKPAEKARFKAAKKK